MVREPKMLPNRRDPTELSRYGGAPKVIVREETTATNGAQTDRAGRILCLTLMTRTARQSPQRAHGPGCSPSGPRREPLPQSGAPGKPPEPRHDGPRASDPALTPRPYAPTGEHASQWAAGKGAGGPVGSRAWGGRTNGQAGRAGGGTSGARRAGVGVGRVRPDRRWGNGAAGAERGRRHAWHRQTAHRGDAGGQPAGETCLAEVPWGLVPARRAQRCFPVAPGLGRAAAVAVREENTLAARRERCLQGPAGLRQSRLGLSAPAVSCERPPGAPRCRHPLAPPPFPGVLRARVLRHLRQGSVGTGSLIPTTAFALRLDFRPLVTTKPVLPSQNVFSSLFFIKVH